MKIKNEIVKSMKKLDKYIKRYFVFIVLNIILSLFSSLVSAAPIAFLKRFIDAGIAGKNEKDIVYAAGAMILVAIVGGVLTYFNTVLSSQISSSVYKDLINELYVKIQSFDIGYFSNVKVGELMTKVLGDTGNINQLILESFDLLKYVCSVLVYLIFSLYTDWKLTLGVLVVAPTILGIVKKYSKRLKDNGKLRQEATGTLNSKLQETIAGIRVIKAFATEKEEIKDFRRKSIELKRYVVRSAKFSGKSSGISEALNFTMVALLLLFGGYRVLRGHDFTQGAFFTVMGALGSMYNPVKRGINVYNSMNSNIISVDRIFEILEEEPEIVNKEDSVKFGTFENGIDFENVGFSYKDSDEEILKGINLKVKKGETIALVGNSGGGKSTLVNLIPRFYDVTKGSIKIDDIDVKDYDITSLRKNIGIVPQETFLFGGTILTNIKYGKQNATLEEVIEASKQANAHEFIQKLENGYETEIGERGVKLSGGQKQRIAIARAILENPQILILDEATSALDNESEKLVQEALEKLMKGKTTFIIAHRLSTIENSDKIVVVQQGEIKEIGNHQELLELENGIYKGLYNKSFKS